MGSDFSEWWVASQYPALANQAARQERAGNWAEAEALWMQAAEQALLRENGVWATCRAEFCHKCEVHRRPPPSGETSV